MICTNCREIRGNGETPYCEWCGECFDAEYPMTGDLIVDLECDILELIEDPARLTAPCKNKLLDAYDIIDEVLNMYRKSI